MLDMLAGKNAIIYGAGGALGSGIARSFAREGARVHLTGRAAEPLHRLAAEITNDGGRAETAVVDALDEDAVAAHARRVAEADGIDISINLIHRGDVQGAPLTSMSTADFTRAVTTGLTSTFITATVAARHMAERGRGVILALNSGASHGGALTGSTAPADAAIDTFIRNLAIEVGPSGVRVLGLWAVAIPETMTVASMAAVNSELKQLDEEGLRGIIGHLDGMRISKRSPSLAEVADVAVFLASDRSAGMTGAFLNVTQLFPS